MGRAITQEELALKKKREKEISRKAEKCLREAGIIKPTEHITIAVRLVLRPRPIYHFRQKITETDWNLILEKPWLSTYRPILKFFQKNKNRPTVFDDVPDSLESTGQLSVINSLFRAYGLQYSLKASPPGSESRGGLIRLVATSEF